MTAGHAWSDWLEIGDAELDNDHHLQMRLVTSLVDAVEEGRPWLANRLARHLRDASAEHFEEEERRMRRDRDPEQPAHRRDHDALLALMDELIAEVEGGDAARAVAAALDLRSTLAAHIGTWDRRLAAHERSAGGGLPAAAP